MRKLFYFRPGKARQLLLAALMLLPSSVLAETFNMPQFGRVEKQVTETIDFYDYKGTSSISGNNNNSTYATVVFTPANPGEAVQITFSKINLKGDGANYPTSLSIFNGNYNEVSDYPTSGMNVGTTDFPDNGKLLARYFSGADKNVINEQNVTFTSTEEDGSLSVCFLWKYAASCEGWEAKVNSVTLTDMTLRSAVPDYTDVPSQIYTGLKDITLGSLNLTAEGILNPFSITAISFELNDPDGAMENVRLIAAGQEVNSQPTVSGNIYTYTFDKELASGDNIFTVKADVSGSAPFYSTSSVKFTDIRTTAPATPAIETVEPVSVTVAALVMMPADGSHVIATIEEGKDILFYDNGGPDKPYTEKTSGIVTFKPAQGAEGKVMLDFSSIQLFNTSSTGLNDEMIVYDGSEVDPEKVLVTLLKQTKTLVRSTSGDGALTVSFKTTTGIPKAGWEATASLFTPRPMSLVGTDVTASSMETVSGGDTDCNLLRVYVKTRDTEPPMTASAITLDFDGTLAQWEKVKVYSTANTETFNLSSAKLLGEGIPSVETITLDFSDPLTLLEGDNYIWVLADVKESAQSGTKVNAIVKSLHLNGEDTNMAAPSETTGRDVRNLVYPAASHPVKTVYGPIEVAHKPYSSTYQGYEGTKTDLMVTFIPAHDNSVCEVDFTKLNLYFYESSWYPSSNVNPVFKIYAGQTAEGDPIYTHVKDNNLKAGEEDTGIGVIRSTAPNGSLTILFNADATGSSTTKDGQFGFSGIVREYTNRPMVAKTAEAIPGELTTVAVTSAVNIPVIGVNVVTEGNVNPVKMDNVTFGLKADTSIYTAIRLASSGRQPSAKTATVIATAEISDGKVTFTPSVDLAEGDNHFWLLADVSLNAAPGSVIDARVETLTVNGAEMTVANADPEGEIVTVNTYDPILGDKEQMVMVGEYPLQVNGVTAAYMTNEYTITAKPALEGGKVTATFTEGAFNVNTSNQYITVIGGAEPFGVDAETVYPVSVTSAREDGQLIIEYHSMTIGKEEGWKCILTCDARNSLKMENFESLPAATDRSTRGSEVMLGGLKFEVSGDKDPITLTSFDYDITDCEEIFSELRIYATGEGAEFLRNNLVATTDGTSSLLIPSEPLIISEAGSQHYWLLGVVKPEAAIGATTAIKPVKITYTVGETESTVDLSDIDAVNLTVIQGFNGEFRIGKSAEAIYPDFGTAIRDMAAGIEGPVRFIVEAGTYNERVDIDHIQGASETNTITFEGESGDPSDVSIVWNNWVEPPYSDDKLEHYYGVVTLRGTSNVILRGMTIRTTNVEMPSVVHIADGSSDLTIENCVISAPTSNTTYNNLTLVNSYVGQSATTLNNRLTIAQSDLKGGYCGIRFGSANLNQPESEGLSVTGCSFADQGYQAIYAYFAKDVTIESNYLHGNAGISDKNYCQIIDLDISGPANIGRNILDYAKNGTYGLYLRRLAGSDDAPVIIANNILDIDAACKPGAAIQFYNSNSKPFTGFVMAHNNVRASGSDVIMPLIINVKPNTKVEGLIANNIFQNTVGLYVIKEQYGPSGATFRNNAGWTSGDTYAYWGGTYDQEMTYTQWMLASEETDGVNAEIRFDNSDETRPLWPESFASLKAGVPLSLVPTDYLGLTRDTTTPTIGAYESFNSAIDIPGADHPSITDGSTLAAADMLTVEADNAALRIYSLNGVMLMSVHIDGLTSIPVGELPRGMYVMTVDDRSQRLLLR